MKLTLTERALTQAKKCMQTLQRKSQQELGRDIEEARSLLVRAESYLLLCDQLRARIRRDQPDSALLPY